MIDAAAFDQERLQCALIGDRIFVADDGRKARQQIRRGRATELFVHSIIPCLGAAARLSRSLIASPSPRRGIFITAIRFVPEASSARKCEKRLAAASIRSPLGERFNVGPDVFGARPKASNASPGSGISASSRNSAF